MQLPTVGTKTYWILSQEVEHKKENDSIRWAAVTDFRPGLTSNLTGCSWGLLNNAEGACVFVCKTLELYARTVSLACTGPPPLPLSRQANMAQANQGNGIKQTRMRLVHVAPMEGRGVTLRAMMRQRSNVMVTSGAGAVMVLLLAHDNEAQPCHQRFNKTCHVYARQEASHQTTSGS